MKSTSISFIIISGILALGCNTNNTANNSSTESAGTDTLNVPVETAKPNSNYKPSFIGQTRIMGVHTSTPYIVEKLAENLDRPWAIIPMPDGRLLISNKSGYMQLLTAEGMLVNKISGFPKVDSDGQGGLLDVALDPAFNQNKMIYWTFSEPNEKGNLMAVAKGKLSEDLLTVTNTEVIFRATPALKSSLHFGSRLMFDKEENLFVSTGERSILEGREQAQWLQAGLGKIFKMTKDGKPAPGNPFINDPKAIPQIYSYGHRNPQSLDIHPVTGDLWECEFGPRGGDELNLIKPGQNYGWPTITYGIEYSGEKVGEGIQKQEGMQQPVYYWDPVVSPSGMTFYKGNTIPEWKNNLFIGGLNSTHIVRLVIENNIVVGEERLLADKKERMRDIAYVNGQLYAISDGGVLFRIQKK